MTIAELRNSISENQDALLAYAKKTYPYLDIIKIRFSNSYNAIIAEMADSSITLLSKANLFKNEAAHFINNILKQIQ